MTLAKLLLLALPSLVAPTKIINMRKTKLARKDNSRSLLEIKWHLKK